MKLRSVIIDDEPLARKVIREHIDDTNFLELVGEAENPVNGSSLLHNEQIDLIFLDIQMPKINGIEFLKNNKHLSPVILTTAFPEYALEGYGLDVLDYLVKPITYERFFKAAVKARDFIDMKNKASAKPAETFDYFFVKCDNKLEKIFFDDVLYVEGMSNYVIIHTMAKKYITYLTMRGIQEFLPQNLFIQIHRSYIVSICKISRLDINEVCINEKTLPISKGYKEQIMQTLDERIAKR